MKIAISAKEKSLDAEVDPRFGRCSYFILIDPDTMEFDAVVNQAGQAMSGAGVKAAQLVIDKGVEAVITGNCGPKAFQTLKAAGVKVYTGAQNTVKEVVKRYTKGELSEVNTPTVPPHYGLN